MNQHGVIALSLFLKRGLVEMRPEILVPGVCDGNTRTPRV